MKFTFHPSFLKLEFRFIFHRYFKRHFVEMLPNSDKNFFVWDCLTCDKRLGWMTIIDGTGSWNWRSSK